MKKEIKNIKFSGKTVNIPIINIRQLTDNEWNRLAYRNMLERKAKANV